jgi:hypothetical protein
MRIAIRKVAGSAAIALTAAVAAAQEPGGRVDVVRVTGCLRRPSNDVWMLSGATEPTVITRADPAAGSPAATSAGANEFKLIGTEEFDLASRKDRLVAVKGLLIKATPTSRLNVTSVTTVAESCPAPPKK